MVSLAEDVETASKYHLVMIYGVSDKLSTRLRRKDGPTAYHSYELALGLGLIFWSSKPLQLDLYSATETPG